jgi:hypothetical protein
MSQNIIKKLNFALAAILALAFVVVVSNQTAGADALPTATIVTGTVTDSSNTPIDGASVTVTCNSNVLNDTTNASGDYAVEFSPSSNCPNASVATVTATKGPLAGTNSDTVAAVTSRINLVVVDVQAVPEIGTIAGVASLAAAGGAIVYARRRQTQM